MIPKIAYFHWSQNGKPMNWMRWASLRSFRIFNPDWDIRLIPTDPDLLHLQLPHQADRTWWRAISATGGFAMATDMLFLRPVPDAWVDCTHALCTKHNGQVFHTAVVGCEMGSAWAAALCRKAEEVTAATGGNMTWCAVGVDITPLAPEGTYPIPADDIVQIPCDQTSRFWGRDGLGIHGDPVGLHWFGGQQPTMDAEYTAIPGADMAIVRLAEKILGGA